MNKENIAAKVMKAIDVDWSDDIVYEYRFVTWSDNPAWREMYSSAVNVGQFRKLRVLSRTMARMAVLRNMTSIVGGRVHRNDIGEFLMVEIMSKNNKRQEDQ